MKTKLTNPIFWIGIFMTIIAAGGVNFETLTSWPLLLEALLSIVQNPVAVVAVVFAVYAQWNDNSTKKLDKFK